VLLIRRRILGIKSGQPLLPEGKGLEWSGLCLIKPLMRFGVISDNYMLGMSWGMYRSDMIFNTVGWLIRDMCPAGMMW